MPNTELPPASGQDIVPSTSLGAKLANIFVAPSEVFDEIKVRPPQAANWVVPLICNIVVGIIFIMVVYSQPAVIQQMRQPTEARLQKLVKDGKMSQKMADQQIAMIDRFISPTFLKVTGIFSIILVQTPILFIFALILWLISSFVFRVELDYMKAVEAVGLATMVSVLAKVVAIPLVVIFGNLYMNIGPVLLLRGNFNPSSPLHIAISSLNLIMLWNLAVLAIALARLSGTRFIKAAIWPFGLWAFWVACMVALVKVAAIFQG